MKIVDIKAYLLADQPNSTRFRWRDGLPGSVASTQPAVVRIVTDAGVDGYAWVGRGTIAMDIVRRRLKPGLVGENPMLKERLWKQVWEIDRIEPLPLYLFGTIDIALWDLTARLAGLPLYQILGGYRDHLPAYASTVTFASIDEYLSVADQCLALGYGAIKIHAWGDARRDAALARALRAHVGDAVALMYDGSGGFDFQDALYLGSALEDSGFLWYEEPMREVSIAAYAQLRLRLRIPLLVAETSAGNHYNAADFVAFHAGDILRTSTGLKGGFTGGLRIAHLADAFNLRAEVHGGGRANLQLACAVANTTYYESLVMSNPVRRDPLVNADGMAFVDASPGIDPEWNADDLHDQAVAEV